MSEFTMQRYFMPFDPVTQMVENVGAMEQFGELSSGVLESFDHNNLFSSSQNIHYFQSKENKVLHKIDTKRAFRDEIEKRKAKSSSGFVNDKTNGFESKNKRRNVRKEQEKPKEVIHIRAKRGQATDTHSLAERVRREKINNKLKCLQDIVPGCQKTMGLVTTLDEIINYVHSLKNQVEFLSMELETACSKMS